MAPYREGVREISAYLRRDPGAALAMNQVVLNSMRFMLEAAGLEAGDSMAGAVKLQGLALAWARIVSVWLDDEDPGLSKTMAEVDRELTRGERAVAGVDRLNDLTWPLRTIAQAAVDVRRRMKERSQRPGRQTEAAPPDDEAGTPAD